MGTSGEHLIQDLLSENMQKQKSIYLIFNYILLVNKTERSTDLQLLSNILFD